MNGMPQRYEGEVPTLKRGVRTSPGAPEMSAAEAVKNVRQYEHSRTQIDLAVKIFNAEDPDDSLRLWMRRPSSGEPSMADVFDDAWPVWRNAHPGLPITDSVLEDFMQESGLDRMAEKLKNELKKAA